MNQNLIEAQNYIKIYVDRNLIEREFEEMDWVYLRLQLYRQQTLSARRNKKLAPRFYGPFQIEEKVGKGGKVAY